MKVIGYVRVSTAGQAEEGDSIAAQEERIRTWAKYSNAAEVVIFRDKGISGKRADNRPGLQSALEAVGEGDALVCYSMSRLSRSIRDTLNLSEYLRKRGADLVSLSENIDTTTAAGKMVFRMLAVFAEYEREVIGERVKTVWHYKRRKGEKTGGNVPFGYRARKGKLYEVESEQAAVRRILELRAAGSSLRQICRALEDEAIARKSGRTKWYPAAVSRIIQRVERDRREDQEQNGRKAA